MNKFRTFHLGNNILDKYFGLRIQPSQDARLSRSRLNLLSNLQIETVLDIGANSGQFALNLRRKGYKGRIISFEPSYVYESLSKIASRDAEWEVHNFGFSNRNQNSTMYLASNNGLSSSILEPKGIYKQNFNITFNYREKVKLIKLDNYCKKFNQNNNYLKIDAQGSEFKILKGGLNSLKYFSVIEFESAFDELYLGEKDHYKIANLLLNHGFKPYQLVVTHWNSKYKSVSLDSIFVKSKLCPQ